MRSIMAVAVLCVGMVSLGADGKNGIKDPQNNGNRKPPGFSPGPYAPPVPNPTKVQRSGGSSTTFPEGGKDFAGSAMDENARFLWIKPGTFKMGSTEITDPDRAPVNETQHVVTLSAGFWLLDHEVTWQEYFAVTKRIYDPKNKDNPATGVSWDDANNFCQKLTLMDRELKKISANLAYRLPTEAEWEFACRAETETAVYVNYENREDALNAIAWWKKNSSSCTHDVRLKIPNAWNLYDMLGNVSEWCSDWYGGDYSSGPVTNPKGPGSGSGRVYRGGTFGGGTESIRSANRNWAIPGYRSNSLGFRPALSPVQ